MKCARQCCPPYDAKGCNLTNLKSSFAELPCASCHRRALLRRQRVLLILLLPQLYYCAAAAGTAPRARMVAAAAAALVCLVRRSAKRRRGYCRWVLHAATSVRLVAYGPRSQAARTQTQPARHSTPRRRTDAPTHRRTDAPTHRRTDGLVPQRHDVYARGRRSAHSQRTLAAQQRGVRSGSAPSSSSSVGRSGVAVVKRRRAESHMPVAEEAVVGHRRCGRVSACRRTAAMVVACCSHAAAKCKSACCRCGCHRV